MGNKILVVLLGLILLSCSHLQSGRYVKSKNGQWVFVESSVGFFGKRVPANTDNALKEADQDDEQEENRDHLGPSVDPQTERGFLWPVPSSRKISSAYGERWGRNHDGIDIAAPVGASILSVDDGVVIYSGKEIGGYGNITVIGHRRGYFSIYAHAVKNFTRKGQRIYKGQVIALVGMTGRSTGPHLHFEIRRNSEAFNPEGFISKNSY